MSLLADLLIKFSVQDEGKPAAVLASMKTGAEQVGAAVDKTGCVFQDAMNKGAEGTDKASARSLALKAAFDQVRQGIAALSAGVNQLEQIFQSAMGKGADGADKVAAKSMTLKKALEQIHQGVEKAAGLFQAAFGKAVLSVGGFVTAGIAASAVGQLMGFQMERLARTVAGLFGPEILKVIGLVQRFTDWIDHLSNGQKRFIATMIESAAVTLAVATALPRVVAGVQALTAAWMAFNASTGEILPIIGLVAAGLIGLASSAAVAGFGFDGLAEIFKPLLDVVNDLWSRLGTALMPVFESLGDVMDSLQTDLEPVMGILAEIADVIGSALIDAINGLTPWVQTIIELFDKWLIAINPVLKLLREVAHVIAVEIKAAMTAWAAVLAALGIQFAAMNGIHLDVHHNRKHAGNHDPLPKAHGGFEGVQDTWKRIAMASRNVGAAQGKSVAQQQLDEQRATTAAVNAAKTSIDRMKPAIA